jgi:hypothetical protein
MLLYRERKPLVTEKAIIHAIVSDTAQRLNKIICTEDEDEINERVACEDVEPASDAFSLVRAEEGMRETHVTFPLELIIHRASPQSQRGRSLASVRRIMITASTSAHSSDVSMRFRTFEADRSDPEGRNTS